MTNLEQEIKSAIINSRINLGTTNDHAKACAAVAKKYIEKSAIDFFVWLCREAKVEVIHAEDALEAQGFKDRDGFVPVLTIKELYNVWALKKTE